MPTRMGHVWRFLWTNEATDLLFYDRKNSPRPYKVGYETVGWHRVTTFSSFFSSVRKWISYTPVHTDEESLAIILEGRDSDGFWNDLENFANPRHYKLKSFSLDPFLLSFHLETIQFNFPWTKESDYWSGFSQNVKSIDVVFVQIDQFSVFHSLDVYDRRLGSYFSRELNFVANVSFEDGVCGFDGVNGWFRAPVHRVVIACGIYTALGDVISRTFIHFNDEVINCTFERRTHGLFSSLIEPSARSTFFVAIRCVRYWRSY